MTAVQAMRPDPQKYILPQFNPVLNARLSAEADKILLPAFRAIVPEVEQWVKDQVAPHRDGAPAVADFGFSRLPGYYSAQLLGQTKAIAVPRCPELPLARFGITGVEAPKGDGIAGITLNDSYFLKNGTAVRDESVHFHELVHVVQWRILGPATFIKTYAIGLFIQGYENSPLEEIAYTCEDRFNKNYSTFDVAQEVALRLNDVSLYVPLSIEARFVWSKIMGLLG